MSVYLEYNLFEVEGQKGAQWGAGAETVAARVPKVVLTNDSVFDCGMAPELCIFTSCSYCGF